MNAADLVSRARAILLDFDGPVTRLLPPPQNVEAADAARSALRVGGWSVRPPVAHTKDHLAVLRYAATLGSDALTVAETACLGLEIRAALSSEITDGVTDFLTSCARTGRKVVLVSNNSEPALQAFLRRQRLSGMVYAVIGRPPRRPDLMKPHPRLICDALDLLRVPPSAAVLIGDSVTDVEAALHCHVPVVGFATAPHRKNGLADAGANSVVLGYAELVAGARQPLAFKPSCT